MLALASVRKDHWVQAQGQATQVHNNNPRTEQGIEGDVGGLYRDALRSSSKFTSYSSVQNRDPEFTVQQQTRMSWV
jgi:hypothetical protein